MLAGDNALLKFEPGLMIWTVVTFLFTFVTLRFIAWKPILGALDEREGRIKESLEKAQQAQREAEQAIAENRARMDESLRQSEELLVVAKQEAAEVRTKMVDEARSESKKIVDQGLRRIEAEKRAAVAEIRKETAALAIQAAERILKKNLDASEQRRIVDDFLSELPDGPVN